MFKNTFILSALSLIFHISVASADSQTIQQINCSTVGQQISQTVQLFVVSPSKPIKSTDDSGNSVQAQQYAEMALALKTVNLGDLVSSQGYFASSGDFPRSQELSYKQSSGATMYVLTPTPEGLSPEGPAQVKVELTVPSDSSQTGSLSVTSQSFDPETGGTKTTQLVKIDGMDCSIGTASSDVLLEVKTLLKAHL